MLARKFTFPKFSFSSIAHEYQLHCWIVPFATVLGYVFSSHELLCHKRIFEIRIFFLSFAFSDNEIKQIWIEGALCHCSSDRAENWFRIKPILDRKFSSFCCCLSFFQMETLHYTLDMATIFPLTECLKNVKFHFNIEPKEESFFFLQSIVFESKKALFSSILLRQIAHMRWENLQWRKIGIFFCLLF